MNKPQLEEFMVFEDRNGEMGVIIKSNSEKYKWKKCYNNLDVGQIFNENYDNKIYNQIVKLYIVEDKGSRIFGALRFMNNGGLHRYKCIYKYVEPIEEIKEIKPINITINLTLNNHKNLEEIMSEIKVVLGKSNFTNPCKLRVCNT